MRFEKKCMLTNLQKRISKDGEKEYLLATVLDYDSRETISCIVKEQLDKLSSLVLMEDYTFLFDLNVGRYINLSIIGVK